MKALSAKTRMYKGMLDAAKQLGGEDLKSRYGQKDAGPPEELVDPMPPEEATELDPADDGLEPPEEELDEKAIGKSGGKTIVIHIGR